ncbi:MAG: hypothetical protein OXC11_00770 [Rhodospirillales bacterium]|nr:hypothetical protein [Rhodospirillales bacterium]
MDLKIDNIRGIGSERVQFPRGEVTDIRRFHARGKTTIAACLAACLCRSPDPLGLAPRTNLYVRRGAGSDDAAAMLTGEGWGVQWKPSAQEFIAHGNPPLVPEVVLRFALPLMSGTKRDASRRWLHALEPEPVTIEELTKELATAVDDVTAARLAKQALTGERGFDQAYGVADTQTREAKGKWEDVASGSDSERRTYGSNVAGKWRPKGWTTDLEGRGLSEIEQELHDAKEAERILRDELAAMDSKVKEVERIRTRNEDRQSHVAGIRRQLEAAERESTGETAEIDRQLREDHARQGKAVEAADLALRAARRAVMQNRDVAERNERAKRLWNEQLHGARQAVERIEVDLSHAQTRLRGIKGTGPVLVSSGTCSSCGQTLPATLVAAATQHAQTTFEREVGEATATCNHLEEDLEKARRKLEELQGTEPTSEVVEDADELQAAVRRGETAYEEADAAQRKLDQKMAAERRRLSSVQSADAMVQQLRGRLEEAQSQGDVPVPDLPSESERDRVQRSLHAAADVVRQQDNARNVRKAFEEASAAHEEASAWGRVREILSPNKGIRARRLKQRSDAMQAAIERVHDSIQSAGAWLPLVRIDTDGPKFLVDELPVEAASGVEQWWTQTICRLGLAVAASSPIAVIDGADIILPRLRETYRLAMEPIARDHDMAIVWAESA